MRNINYCFTTFLFEGNKSCWNNFSIIKAKTLVEAMAKWKDVLFGNGISINESTRKTMAHVDMTCTRQIPSGYMFEAERDGAKYVVDVEIKVGRKFCVEI